MEDMSLYCIQCENIFTLTVSEQKRLNALGFDVPKRCPECRKNKQKSAGSKNGRSKRGRKRYEEWEIVGNDE